MWLHDYLVSNKTKAKINVFKKKFLFTPRLSVRKKIKKTLILAFEANSALSRENETKIVKITHSAQWAKSIKAKKKLIQFEI